MRVRSAFLLLSIAPYCAFGQTYTISTFAGGGLPVNVPGVSESIGAVTGVAVDSSGNVFVASTTLNVVLRLDAQTGVLTVVAGNGTVGFSGDNGPATSAQLNDPTGLAVDASGNLYIADTGNHVVREVSNGVITTVAGNGTLGYSGDKGPATKAQLIMSQGGCLAVDSLGNIYIADGASNRIREVSNGVITTVAGNGTAGFTGDHGPAIGAELHGPEGVAVDSAGNLYIADTYNERVREVSNGVITTVAGNGGTQVSHANGSPALSVAIGAPLAVAVDSAGNFYFSEYVGVSEVSNGLIHAVAAGGDGIAVDSAGNLYVAGNYSSQVYSLIKVANGVSTVVAGNGLMNYGGDNRPATSAQLNYPWGVAVDSNLNVYISDQGNCRVREVSKGVITTVLGESCTFTGGSPSPLGVAVDSSGNLYVTDGISYRVFEDVKGVITTVAGGGVSSADNIPATNAVLVTPVGVAVDSLGNIYIAEDNHIRKVYDGVITTVAGDGSRLGDALNNPSGVALDSSGNLYIADSGNNLIREISNGVITTVAGTGKAGFSGDNGPAVDAELSNPLGVAVDSAGNVYIADSGNNRIREVSNGVITTIAGGDNAGFSGDNGPATSAELNYPTGVAVDYEGDVYVVDRNDLRVRELTPSAASSCTYSVTPTSLQSPSAGGSFNFSVQTSGSCFWNVSALPGWITVAGASLGSGPATVTLVVPPNYSAAGLNANVSVAGVPVAITQSASSTTGPVIGAITNAASNLTGPIAPGEIVVLYGTGLGPAELATLALNSAGDVGTQLGGTSVTFNGTPAPMVYTSATQVSAIVPYEVSGTTAQVALTYQGQTSPVATVQVAPSAPALFTANSSGQGPAAATNQDGSYNSENNPAPIGSIITFYATGEGQTSPVGIDGKPGAAPLPQPVLPVTVYFSGRPETPQYAGGAPGEVAGVMQINVQVPYDIDPFGGGVVTIQVGNGASPSGVTFFWMY